MLDLQATIEFVVELERFHNIDLFQRGFYNLQTFIKVPPKAPIRYKVSLLRKPVFELAAPPCITPDNIAVSKTFQILYKKEEVQIDDCILFQVSLLVDSTKIEECINNANIQLGLELHYGTSERPPLAPASLEQVSSRTLQLHLGLSTGLHSHIPILFDYFHLAAVSMTIHGTITSLHQATFSVPRPPKSGWLTKISGNNSPARQTPIPTLECVLFGNPTKPPLSANVDKYSVASGMLSQACVIYHSLCTILLRLRSGLCMSFNDHIALLPPNLQFKIEPYRDNERLEVMCEIVRNLSSEEEMVEAVNTSLAQLSGEICLVWTQFLEVLIGQERIRTHLRDKYHQARVQRFSESFFTLDHPKIDCLAFSELSSSGYSNLVQTLRGSAYGSTLPPLAIECTELDGDASSVPVIIEDRYLSEVTESPARKLNLDEVTLSLKNLTKNSSPFRSVKSRSPFTERRTNKDLIEDGKQSEKDRHGKSKGKRGVAKHIKHIKPDFLRKTSGSNRGGAIPRDVKCYEINNEDSLCMQKRSSLEEGRKHPSPMFSGAVPISISMPILSPNTGSSSGINVLCEGANYDSADDVRAMRNTYSAEDILNGRTDDQSDATSTSSTTADHSFGGNALMDAGLDPQGMMDTAQENLALLEADDINISLLEYAGLTEGGGQRRSARLSFLQNGNANEDQILNSLSKYLQKEMIKSEANLRRSDSEPDRTKDAEECQDVQSCSAAIDGATASESHKSMVKETESKLGLESNNRLDSENRLGSELDRIEHEREENRVSSAANLENYNDPPINGITLDDEEDEEEAVAANQKMNSSQNGNVQSPTREAKGFNSGSEHRTENECNSSKDGVHANGSSCQSESTNSLSTDACQSSSENAQGAVNASESAYGAIGSESRSECAVGAVASQNEIGNVHCTASVVDSEDLAIGNENASASTSAVRRVDALLDGIIAGETVKDGGTTLADNTNTTSTPNNTNFDPDKVYTTNTNPTAITASNIDTDITNPTSIDHDAVLDPTKSKKHKEHKHKHHHTHSGSDMSNCAGCFSFIHSSGNSPNGSFAEPCLVKPTLPLESSTSTSSSSIVNAVGQSNEASSHGSLEVMTEVDEHRPTDGHSYTRARGSFKQKLQYPGRLYSDMDPKASQVPYFSLPSSPNNQTEDEEPGRDVHLIICVHGLDGNRADLRLLKTYLELGLPGEKLDFLMSESNQGDTFANFETMTDRLVREIVYYTEVFRVRPKRVSFIGHSLGNIIIRSALTRPELAPFLNKLHTFLSLSGPHLGQLYNSSTIVNTGMWLMQKWKKSNSLLQLALRDHADLRQTFLYKLSRASGLSDFKNVVLVGSLQDRYVPIHSARIELCRAAAKDRSLYGCVYTEMLHNMLQPLVTNPDTSIIRYDVHHTLSTSANSLIGRAAHIAVLDSELFIEKFMVVTGLNYFK